MSTRDVGKTAWWVVLVINLLDVTTSLIASPVDRSYRPEPRAWWEWSIQLALLVPLLWNLGRRARALPEVLRALPVPRVALVVCGLLLLVELAHIALRLETFPFSPVAMYSNAVTVSPRDVQRRWTFVVMADGRQSLLSLERESTPFGQFLSDFDYRMTAVVTMYTRSDVVVRWIRDRVVAAGYRPPVLVEVAYESGSGRVIAGPTRRVMLPEERGAR